MSGNEPDDSDTQVGSAVDGCSTVVTKVEPQLDDGGRWTGSWDVRTVTYAPSGTLVPEGTYSNALSSLEGEAQSVWKDSADAISSTWENTPGTNNEKSEAVRRMILERIGDHLTRLYAEDPKLPAVDVRVLSDKQVHQSEAQGYTSVNSGLEPGYEY